MNVEPLTADDFGGKIPPHRAFRIVLRDEVELGKTERIVMAHSMTIVDGALIFYVWRVETLNDQPVVIQFCHEAFANWEEAHEVQMPAVPAGKKAH